MSKKVFSIVLLILIIVGGFVVATPSAQAKLFAKRQVSSDPLLRLPQKPHHENIPDTRKESGLEKAGRVISPTG